MSMNQTLAELFQTAAAVMEIRGEPVFKAIAFSKVARLLGDMTTDIAQAVQDGSIDKMTGIGKSSRKIIEDYVLTGVSPDVEELKSTVPGGLLPMLAIPSMGPKTVALLWKQRNITSVSELSTAIEQGLLKGLKGIGDKKITAIKEGIELLATAGLRKGVLDVLPGAVDLLNNVRAMKYVIRAELAGSLRRWKETVGDIDIIAALDESAPSDAGAAVTHAFTQLAQVNKILGRGDTKASVVIDMGLQADLRIVPVESFGAAIQYFTGSKEHNVKLRSLAQDKGMTLNEWGLYRLSDYENYPKQTGKPPAIKAVAGRNEADIYTALSMDYIEPELREDRGEIEKAIQHTLPDLISVKHIRGDLHSHTTASDGQNSILEMAEAAKAIGYEYLAITDHSKSQVIANGLSAERLLAHIKAIHKARDQVKDIYLLAGCEVDILADGSMDYEDAVLAELDIVIGSPHTALKQEAGKATDRICRAIDNQYVNIIGHPTGRIINARGGLPIDIKKVATCAKQAGVALEMNAGWPRWDLNDLNCRAVLEAGAIISINTDAHAVSQFAQMSAGIHVLRRAGAMAHQVCNTFTLEQLKAFLKK
jgi:DNA polymerase (family X)